MVIDTNPSAGIARPVWMVRCKTASHRSAAALEPTLVQNNRWFHHLLTDGINVEYRAAFAVAFSAGTSLAVLDPCVPKTKSGPSGDEVRRGRRVILRFESAERRERPAILV